MDPFVTSAFYTEEAVLQSLFARSGRNSV